MHDQRIVGGPILGGKDPATRRRIKRVGAQPVDGLSGKHNKAAGTQDLCRAADFGLTENNGGPGACHNGAIIA